MTAPDKPGEGPADLIPTRGTLLNRLKNWEDSESWRDFFDTYWRLIYNFSLRNGLSHEEAQEAVQETVVAVAKSIGRFEYDPKVCRFKTWLLGVTRSKIANQLARRARQPAGLGDMPLSDTGSTAFVNRVPAQQPHPLEQSWDEEWRKNLMETALQRVKRRVSIEQYQMFDLYVLKQWSASEVATALGVTIGHVYVAKHRIARLLRKEIEALEAQQV